MNPSRKRKHRSTLSIFFLICRFLILLSLALFPPSKAGAVSLPDLEPLSEKEEIDLQNFRPPASKGEDIPYVPLPSGKVQMPRAGTKNAYRITVTKELEAAYDAYLGGDGEAALAALKKAETTSKKTLFLWQVSFLRAQTLIMMGRAADAEVELKKTAPLEVAFFGTNLNTRALRGEAKLWLGDVDGAMADFAQVVKAIGFWRLPTTFYAFPAPTELAKLFFTTTAQLRSFLGLAGAYMLKGNYEAALPWAEEAENRFNDVHYVSNHSLYGSVMPAHADSYYGRALNLAFLASARIGAKKKSAGNEKLFQAAISFFNAIGYPSGRATVEALRARAYYDTGQYDKAEPLARAASKLAAEKGLADLVWRVEVLLGEALLKQGRKTEAEEAFRKAQIGVESVSGALGSDRAKLRFGVGKEDITYRLAKLDAEKNDVASLFRDLERGRARAFVDMLADRAVASGPEARLVEEIRALDGRILKQRLIISAAGGKKTENLKAVSGLLRQRKEKLRAIRARDPEIADVLSISARELPEVQAKLAPGEVMAYALPARKGDKLQFLLITRSKVKLRKSNINPETLRMRLETFTDAIALKDAAAQKTAAESLQNDLMVSGWGAEQALYIVPSGDLYFVPWGAFNISLPVSVLPTGGWLSRLPRANPEEKGASVVGDPAFGGDLQQLPGARQEAATVGRLYRVNPLIGEQATEEALRAQIGSGVRVLHLATHGFFDPDDPLESAIVLSGKGKAARITAKRIFEKPLRAKLVVLSACETGMGQTISGDDLLGLARSFYLGGALSVLNSLWPVEDEGTRLFMEKFHKEAFSGDYGSAWLKARDELQRKGFPPSVFGAFVLGGSLRG